MNAAISFLCQVLTFSRWMSNHEFLFALAFAFVSETGIKLINLTVFCNRLRRQQLEFSLHHRMQRCSACIRHMCFYYNLASVSDLAQIVRFSVLELYRCALRWGKLTCNSTDQFFQCEKFLQFFSEIHRCHENWLNFPGHSCAVIFRLHSTFGGH